MQFFSQDKSLIDKSNISSAKLLSNSFVSHNVAKNLLENSQTIVNHQEDEFENQIVISESLSEAEPNDFGYFTLGRIPEEEEDKKEDFQNNIGINFKSAFFTEVNKAIKKVNNFSLKKINLVKHLNDIKYDERDMDRSKRLILNGKELIHYFAREENEYRNLNIPDLNKNDVYDNGEMVQNTMNSFIVRQQNVEMSKNNLDAAVKMNNEYQRKKETYEIDLLIRSVNKYDESLKQFSKVHISFPEPYRELKKESSDLREEYKRIQNTNDKLKLFSIRARALQSLANFIHRMSKQIDDRPKDKQEAVEVIVKVKNFKIWKKKLSELVNIWELFSSNGIDLKFPLKYLIFKKYFTQRSLERQNNIGGKAKEGGDDNDLLKSMMSLSLGICGVSQSNSVPKSVLMPSEFLTILMEILMFILLLYNLFVIPMIVFLGYTNTNLLTIEKVIDIFFYSEFVMNWRRVFKDKSNNYVYDIKRIFWNYINGRFFLDLCSSIPWHFFFIYNIKTYTMMNKVVMCIKVLRITKLFPILAKLEALKGTNYIRLLKLVFIFFFFAHWLGCIIYSSVDFSLDYSSMNESCYISNLNRSKENLSYMCRYMLSLYTTSYMIPGQYTSNMKSYISLNPSTEYATILVVYMIGQVLSAYIFGGMASIIKNLDQGQNFFTDKIDMLNEHMRFYEVNRETMIDVMIYFNYMWQRHKDVIYGKYHFDLLSRSLREKFERLNLPGNEILLANFYNLNPGNTKLIGNILMNLNKVILFPYEMLFEEGSVTKGIYILLNGDVILTNQKIQNLIGENFELNYADIKTLSEEAKLHKAKVKLHDEKNSVVFPLISALIKTGRNFRRCYSRNFTDLLFLPIAAFDQLVSNFPIEMHVLKYKIMDYVSKTKMFDNEVLFKAICRHSSRSIGKYYEKEFDKITIWIPIPIPISQRKIARNYIESFVRKVRNQWREILLMGDLNFCLNSYSVINVIKTKNDMEELLNLGKVNSNSKNPIDKIKSISKAIEKISKKYFEEYSKQLNIK